MTQVKDKIEIVKGDITKLKVDVIVNAANKSLLGGAGVDGAIHQAAGPQLVKACRKLHGCETGEAKMTRGYKLPAKYVIHTVGPKYYETSDTQATKLLIACYQNSLDLARLNHLHSIAFPAISTGVYFFPAAKAAKIAYQTVKQYLTDHQDYDLKVILCAYDQKTADLYHAQEVR